MLTCEDVHALLPGLASGEAIEGEAREHLARCSACAEELEQQTDEVERLRSDLTLMAPSPFLEEAVLEAAGAAPERSPRRRWPVAVLAAAAALLVLFLALPRDERGSEPAPAGEARDEVLGGAQKIHIPPSAATVQEARLLNRQLTKSAPPPSAGWNAGNPRMKLSRSAFSNGVVHRLKTDEAFLPPPDDALHRYVYGDDGFTAGDVTLETGPLSKYWPVGMGAGLLAKIGGEIAISEGVEITRGGKTWLSKPGYPVGELIVASPEKGGAEARIQVSIEPHYEGTLLLPEPLARALGLNFFEIPGYVQIKSAAVVGHRARARVKIAELEFDEVVEVQVWPPDLGRRHEKPRPFGIRMQAHMEKADLPTEVIVGRELAWKDPQELEFNGDVMMQKNPGGVDWVKLDGTGTWHVLMRFGAWAASETFLIPGPFDVGQPTHLHEHNLRIGRLDVATTLEPGTPLTLARVWRGRTAIPSRTGVVTTRVGENGRVLAPYIWGETCSTLRALLRPEDAPPTFVDLVVDASALSKPWLPIHVLADGTVQLDHAEYATMAAGALDPTALGEVRDAVAALADAPGYRDADGMARYEIVLHVQPGASWRVLQALLQVGATEGIRDYRFQRAGASWQSLGGPLPYRLPVDGGIGAAPPPPQGRLLEVVLTRRPEGDVQIRIRTRSEDGELESRADQEGLGLEESIRVLGQDGAADRAIIKTPPPFGARVDAHSVIRVLEALKAAGLEDIALEGTPIRLPR